MPNPHKSLLLSRLTERFGRIRELAGSRSLFVVGEDAARIYIRYSKMRMGTPFVACHPEEAELAAKPTTPDEGPMHLASGTGAADESIGPSARKERSPQDDNAMFRALVKGGQRLAEIHVNYEQQPEYKLTKVEKKGEKLDYCVNKMKLSKDKTTLIYNQFLTLSGIPKETYDYRLGNRSALEWVIDHRLNRVAPSSTAARIIASSS